MLSEIKWNFSSIGPVGHLDMSVITNNYILNIKKKKTRYESSQ